MIRKVFAPLLLAAALLPGVAGAASYQLLPVSGQYPAGTSFSVAISVSSPEQAINAVSGRVTFPASQLSVVSVSKAGSIVDMWVQEPAFSNAEGSISFEGIALNPGFQGASGRVLTVTFRTRVPGTATIGFASGAVLANDGQGTNVIVGLARATYAIGDAAVTPRPPVSTAPVSPTVPVKLPSQIRSITHPEPDTWVSSPRAAFDWDSPSGVIGTLYDLDRSTDSIPVTELAGRAASTEVSLASWPGDGAYYFHLRFRTPEGLTPVLHRKISVDRTPPDSLTVKEVKSDDPSDPLIVLELEATDRLSGISGYSFMGPSGVWEGLEVSDEGITELRAWQPGEQTIRVRATDGAGNSREEEVPLYRKPLASPTITEFTPAVNSLIGNVGSFVGFDAVDPHVRGTAELERKVHVYFALGGVTRHEVEAEVGESGRWEARYPDLGAGDWEVYAVSSDARGAKSFPSESVSVTSYGTWDRIVPILGWIGIGVLVALAAWIGLVAEYRFIGRAQRWFAALVGRHRDEDHHDWQR